MKLAHLAGLACGLALLLGACSSNNTSATTGGTSGTTTGGSAVTDGGGANGNGAGTGDGMDGGDDDKSAEQEAAEDAVAEALAATSENSDAAIEAARAALKAWVDAAQDALEEAEADPENVAAVGRAARERNDAMAYQEAQEEVLIGREAFFAWYGTGLARVALANGEAVMPPEGTNAIMKAVAPRTDSDDDPLDARLKSDTFKSLMYEEGKMVFSVSDDEFKVGGYVSRYRAGLATNGAIDSEAVTGLTLTSSGVVIRTGNFNADYADALKDITVGRDDGSAEKNQWDLTLTFNAPRHLTVPAGDDPDRAASWTGNSDFYWKGIAMADKSQLKGGANYESDAFKQAAGYKDLGTYELWLSNHIGVDTRLEPQAGQTAECPVSGVRKSSCPEDDVNLYLSYAAYGMFAYSADPETYRSTTSEEAVGWNGRVSSMHFGYEAFADEDGKKTTDIDEAITSGTFSGQTTGLAVRGSSDQLLTDPDLANPFREKKPLRGDVSLTVSIPKTTGAGSLLGKIENLEEWDGNAWKAYAGIVAIHLHAGTTLADTVPIGNAGTFTGSATIQVDDDAYVAPAAATNENAVTSAVGLATDAGSTTHSFNNGGAFTGNFYGPRTADDLEVAGSWNTGLGDTAPNLAHWSLLGSFGAKQRQ